MYTNESRFSLLIDDKFVTVWREEGTHNRSQKNAEYYCMWKYHDLGRGFVGILHWPVYLYMGFGRSCLVSGWSLRPQFVTAICPAGPVELRSSTTTWREKWLHVWCRRRKHLTLIPFKSLGYVFGVAVCKCFPPPATPTKLEIALHDERRSILSEWHQTGSLLLYYDTY